MGEDQAMQATPHETLIGRILDPRIPKNEEGWAAAREIEHLREAHDLLTAERDALGAEVMLYRNKMGRIAIALFGDQNNVTDEACIERAANVVEELADTNGLFQDAITLAQMNKDRLDVAEAEVARLSAACAEKDAALRMLDTYMAQQGHAPLDGELIRAALATEAGRNWIDATGAVETVVQEHDEGGVVAYGVIAPVPDAWAGASVKIVRVKP